jgi:hypothetical protein
LRIGDVVSVDWRLLIALLATGMNRHSPISNQSPMASQQSSRQSPIVNHEIANRQSPIVNF